MNIVNNILGDFRGDNIQTINVDNNIDIPLAFLWHTGTYRLLLWQIKNRGFVEDIRAKIGFNIRRNSQQFQIYLKHNSEEEWIMIP